jgi:hypothetical protein
MRDEDVARREGGTMGGTGSSHEDKELWNISQGSLEEAGRNWKLLRE